ncbi:MAG TPA: PSD1 and planctomycete cytochrome C domain-containing protein [Chthonomonadaceae bacterium]|nr:PSD1 and planctomycete cytochrome C domain-containing protein [Chthonomonadaceae bacterium]
MGHIPITDHPVQKYGRWRAVLLMLAPLILAYGLPAAGAGKVLKAKHPVVRVDFAREVRPILANNCFACHGRDEKKRQAGLRLDVRAGAVARRVLVPGKPEASLLIQRVTAGSAFRMPPAVTGKKLTPTEITILRQWIQQGAVYKPHWAFIAPHRPSLPKVKQAKWVQNPIDAFILARLEKEGLTPAPPADRYTLLRRVSLDLIGLPPTPQEVDAFIQDTSPNAYEKVVDRLLASPHYGEKWARMWMDLARYADSAGYGSDPLRPNLWPYRDWVINAFNRNLPYDRFTIEQIAGDLLPNPTQEQLIATAFHRNTMTNTEGGTDPEEFRVAAVKDRAITTAQVWMGITMGCAQCHSHKYDPISQKEFYRFFAYFNQTEDANRADEQPTLSLPTEEQTKRIAALKSEIAALEANVAAMPGRKAELEAKQKELASIQPLAVPIMRELPPDKRRKTFVLTLANFLQPGEEVQPGTPAAFNPLPPGAPQNRLGVALWLVSRQNPLTARVAVNRFWAQIFGTGIVETEEDFGQQGALPTHQELLDWLAVEFMDSKWDMKALLKKIVMSATYRQSARVTPLLLAKDPRDRLLARFPRRRLDAEMVRDQALALSGLLSQKIGGPSVFPPQPEGLWQAAFNGERTWPTSTGEDRYRRGLYTFWRRTVPYPSMATFDAPSREVCTVRRIPTNTPLQALVTLNDPAYVEMAQALGRRIAREGGASLTERVRFALRLVTAHPPQPEQIQPLVSLYEQELAYYRTHAEDAKKLATDPLGPLPQGMDMAEQAAWTVVANVLLNLDGVLTKG